MLLATNTQRTHSHPRQRHPGPIQCSQLNKRLPAESDTRIIGADPDRQTLVPPSNHSLVHPFKGPGTSILETDGSSGGLNKVVNELATTDLLLTPLDLCRQAFATVSWFVLLL
ncbi:hypothetical protein JTE90_022512 [Oedothorax gibbosus]|uniref:Uncharacterized protein n=1 Tax=Oedothorax gibbosus TaxID=931172 RepID=A0AAV6V1L9_9ARAC|nr:hypothetical protein JTE90_022512 [Oedothorax gibbosus]